MTRASLSEWEVIQDILQNFCCASGMVINPQKLFLLHSGVQMETLMALKEFLLFPLKDLALGFKYLGYLLKSDSYKADDWQWLLDKYEAQITHWSNKWLSLGGRYVLIKVVLESQPVYWMALAHIPIVVLQRICKLCFDFLWSGNSHSHRYHLSNWMSIARPKKHGGWGLRNIFLFYRALATNTMWRALMRRGIWKNILKDKYFPHTSVLTWLRSVDLKHPFGSQTWKNLRNTLPIIIHWMAWKSGSGVSIQVGKDVIIGLGQEAILSRELITSLNQKHIFLLYQASRTWTGNATGTSWISSVELGLDEPLAEEWERYTQLLRDSGIALVEKQDELIWMGGDKSGHISVKNVYEALSNSLWNYKLGGWREIYGSGTVLEIKALHLAFSRK
jgi:hypothetical protein